MHHFRYRAARSDGKIIRGLVEASTGGEARGVLVDRGLHPLAVVLAESWEGRQRPAGRRELAIVFRSIAALVSAGVPLERAIGASEALARGPLYKALAEARAQLRGGQTLAEALEKARGVVPPLVTGMLRAGERGSRLGPALDQVAAHLEHEADLLGRVQQALAYPLLLLVAGSASVLVIGTVVVPKFADLLGDLGQELPPTTRALLAGSSFLAHDGILLLVTAIGLGWALVTAMSTPSGRLRWHRLLLELPVVGALRQTIASARLSRALSGMLYAGMPLLSALDATGDALGDRALAERLHRVRDRVAGGQALTPALEHERALSRTTLQLFAVGEGSGQLAAMAARAGDLAAQEAERGLRVLVSLLEPGLIILFGGLVAFVAAALLQAVYSIRPGAG
jgi:general secretion pathway protein F